MNGRSRITVIVIRLLDNRIAGFDCGVHFFDYGREWCSGSGSRFHCTSRARHRLRLLSNQRVRLILLVNHRFLLINPRLCLSLLLLCCLQFFLGSAYRNIALLLGRADFHFGLKLLNLKQLQLLFGRSFSRGARFLVQLCKPLLVLDGLLLILDALELRIQRIELRCVGGGYIIQLLLRGGNVLGCCLQIKVGINESSYLWSCWAGCLNNAIEGCL